MVLDLVISVFRSRVSLLPLSVEVDLPCTEQQLQFITRAYINLTTPSESSHGLGHEIQQHTLHHRIDTKEVIRLHTKEFAKPTPRPARSLAETLLPDLRVEPGLRVLPGLPLATQNAKKSEYPNTNINARFSAPRTFSNQLLSTATKPGPISHESFAGVGNKWIHLSRTHAEVGHRRVTSPSL